MKKSKYYLDMVNCWHDTDLWIGMFEVAATDFLRRVGGGRRRQSFGRSSVTTISGKKPRWELHRTGRLISRRWGVGALEILIHFKFLFCSIRSRHFVTLWSVYYLPTNTLTSRTCTGSCFIFHLNCLLAHWERHIQTVFILIRSSWIWKKHVDV